MNPPPKPVHTTVFSRFFLVRIFSGQNRPAPVILEDLSAGCFDIPRLPETFLDTFIDLRIE